MSKILVTGSAGFIGSHLSNRLVKDGHEVIGLDSLNSYYDVDLKRARLEFLGPLKGYRFVRMDLLERERMAELFAVEKFDAVANLAAQVGVRYSVQNPSAFIDSNLVGFANVLEGCRQNGVRHLVFASSSSVYGANTSMPYSVHDNVDHPISLYAATKKANELMAHSYATLFKLPCTGLRFFTVYGPWGRPDMALFLFTKAILDGNPINVFNFGNMKRDFTYVDDIVEGITRVLMRIPSPNPNWNGNAPDPGSSFAPYKNYNMGNNNPVDLLQFIEAIESAVGRKARKNLLPMQPGDVPATCANIDELEQDIGFKPATCLRAGIGKFVEWYRWYYKV